jgi:hypothetical protein
MTCLLVWGKEQMFFEYIINITLLQIFTTVSPKLKDKIKTTIRSAGWYIRDKILYS